MCFPDKEETKCSVFQKMMSLFLQMLPPYRKTDMVAAGPLQTAPAVNGMLHWTCHAKALNLLCNGLHMCPDQAHLLHSRNCVTVLSTLGCKTSTCTKIPGHGFVSYPWWSPSLVQAINIFLHPLQPRLCFLALHSPRDGPMEFGYISIQSYIFSLPPILLSTDKAVFLKCCHSPLSPGKIPNSLTSLIMPLRIWSHTPFIFHFLPLGHHPSQSRKEINIFWSSSLC